MMHCNKHTGFTLPELMIALLIASLLLGLAVPLGRGFLLNNHITAQAYQLLNAINASRSAAIQYAAPATLCASADGENCSTDWSAGQILFIDKSGHGQVDPAAEIIHIWGPIAKGLSLRWQGFFSDSYIQAQPSGIGETMNGSFFICSLDKNSTKTASIIINRAGRARLVIEDVDNVVC